MKSKNKTFFFLFLFFLHFSLIACANGDKAKDPHDYEQPKVEKVLKLSVLGDSYSTFKGFVTPLTNAVWYPRTDDRTDVVDVEQTWWALLVKEKGLRLEFNNSFSGSTICNTGYNGKDATATSFITRMNNLGKPDIILILGGTNDSWAKSPIGEYKFSDWQTEDLKSFRPAFAYMLDYLQSNYPKAKIINLINSGLKQEIVESQEKICNHYIVKSVQLTEISKQSNHPDIEGMKAIKEQVLRAIRE